ncbi:MAG: hypothetical protein REI94_10255 [Moraxellaceae bacterium]|nr:hypothetical protein [Moraxellaceae bacterium]
MSQPDQLDALTIIDHAKAVVVAARAVLTMADDGTLFHHDTDEAREASAAAFDELELKADTLETSLAKAGAA